MYYITKHVQIYTRAATQRMTNGDADISIKKAIVNDTNVLGTKPMLIVNYIYREIFKTGDTINYQYTMKYMPYDYVHLYKYKVILSLNYLHCAYLILSLLRTTSSHKENIFYLHFIVLVL